MAHIIIAGNLNVDLLMGGVPPWPTPGTEILVDHYELRVGGAAGNTALTLGALGADYDLIANVGDDEMGRWLGTQLEPALLLTSAVSTAVTVGLSHPNFERTFFSHLGHLRDYPVDAVEQAIEEAQPGDLLLLCGYFLLPGLRCVAKALLQRAKGRGLVTLLDTGHPPEGWTETVHGELEPLLPQLDFFLPNLGELYGLTGKGALEPALTRIDQQLSGRAIVKLGSEGAAFLASGSLSRVAAPKVNVIDTVGAGDAFNAGFLAALQRGTSWQEAVRVAVQVASLAVASSPRRYPAWKELLEPVRN